MAEFRWSLAQLASWNHPMNRAYDPCRDPLNAGGHSIHVPRDCPLDRDWGFSDLEWLGRVESRNAFTVEQTDVPDVPPSGELYSSPPPQNNIALGCCSFSCSTHFGPFILSARVKNKSSSSPFPQPAPIQVVARVGTQHPLGPSLSDQITRFYTVYTDRISNPSPNRLGKPSQLD